MNPLLQTLLMVKTVILCGPIPADLLALQMGGISPATLKRQIKDARLLGASIESYRSDKTWAYRLTNAEQINARLNTWIELEQQRDLKA